jgi:hypothetical protein
MLSWIMLKVPELSCPTQLITIKAEKNVSYQWKKTVFLLEQFNTTMFGSAESFEVKLKQHIIFALYTISDILFHCNILTLNYKAGKKKMQVYYTSIFVLLYLVLIAKALHITFSTHHRLLLIWILAALLSLSFCNDLANMCS